MQEAVSLLRTNRGADLADLLDPLAEALACAGRAKEATQLIGATAMLRQRTGVRVTTREQFTLDRRVEALRDQLGGALFSELYEAGKTLSVDDVTNQFVPAL